MSIPIKLQALNRLKTRYSHSLIQASFETLYEKYVNGDSGFLDWNLIAPLSGEKAVHLDALDAHYVDIGRRHLHEVALLKLNGGLGTSMGCQGPKSLVKVTQDLSFMDLILQQLIQTRQKYDCEIPLVLMNSPSTHHDTLVALKGTEALSFVQHEFPRIDPRTLGCFDFPGDHEEEWYPPGHGNLYLSLVLSGVCDALLAKGIRTIMVSNSDNLGPDISPKILGYMRERCLDFLMEATPKTKLDVKGGSPVWFGPHLTLLERSQIDPKHHHCFEDISQFSTFNTNTLWIQLDAIKAHLEVLSTQLPMIVNAKRVHDQPVVQLETAMGSALGVFKKSEVLVVPRDRFIAVKHCSDLMLLRSDAIEIHDGCWFSYNDLFKKNGYAAITLGDHFKTVSDFESRVKVIPSLKGVRSLHLEGDITILDKVVFEGDVSLKVPSGEARTLPQDL